MSTPAPPPKGYENYIDSPQSIAPPKGYEAYRDLPGAPVSLANPTQVAPLVGRGVAASLPVIGGAIGGLAGGGPDPITAAAGAGLGSAVSAELRNEFPKLFGEGPTGGLDAAKGIATDATIGGLTEGLGMIPRAISKQLPNIIGRTPLANFPAVRQGVAATLTQQALKKYQFPESQVLESAASNAGINKDDLIQNVVDAFNKHPDSMDQVDPEFYHPEVKQAIKEQQDTFGKNTVGDQLVRLDKEFSQGGDVAGSQTYKQITNTALSDLTHVRNFKIATGEPKTLEQLATTKLLTNGFKASDGTLDSKYILDELGGKNSEIYDEAISPRTKQKIQDLMGEIEKQKVGHGTSDSLLKYSNRGLILSGVAALKYPEGAALGAAASAPIPITNYTLSKLMSDPTTAKLVTQAIKTPTSAPQASLLSKVLGYTISNTARAAEIPAETKDQ